MGNHHALRLSGLLFYWPLVLQPLFAVAAGATLKAAGGADLQLALNKGGKVMLHGQYTGPATIVVPPGAAINIQGPATLINIRLIIESADVEISNLVMQEQDCITDQLNYARCPSLGAMITIGYIGFPVNRAYLHDLTITTTRAYTAIETGYAGVQNFTIERVRIVDLDQSAISIYQGSNVRLSTIDITGQKMGWKDDGIALTSVFGAIQNVTIDNVTAHYTGDIVGIGSGMQFDMHDVAITNSRCTGCWYSIMMKTSLTPDPTQVGTSFSPSATIRRLTLDSVQAARQ